MLQLADQPDGCFWRGDAELRAGAAVLFAGAADRVQEELSSLVPLNRLVRCYYRRDRRHREEVRKGPKGTKYLKINK